MVQNENLQTELKHKVDYIRNIEKIEYNNRKKILEKMQNDKE